MKDTIYRSNNTSIQPFEFNEQVVGVFPDMIERSIPGYPGIERSIMSGKTPTTCSLNSNGWIEVLFDRYIVSFITDLNVRLVKTVLIYSNANMFFITLFG